MTCRDCGAPSGNFPLCCRCGCKRAWEDAAPVLEAKRAKRRAALDAAKAAGRLPVLTPEQKRARRRARRALSVGIPPARRRIG